MSIQSRMYLGLALLVASVNGYAEIFGDWGHGEDDDTGDYWALTINDSENVLGQFCYASKGECLWLLGVDTACEAGSKSTYPVLLNSESGAVSLYVYCFGKIAGSGEGYRYAFSDFDAIDGLVREGKRLGIAFPLEGDRFAVERFSLVGAGRALDAMRAEAKRDAAGPTGTKSSIL